MGDQDKERFAYEEEKRQEHLLVYVGWWTGGLVGWWAGAMLSRLSGQGVALLHKTTGEGLKERLHGRISCIHITPLAQILAACLCAVWDNCMRNFLVK